MRWKSRVRKNWTPSRVATERVESVKRKIYHIYLSHIFRVLNALSVSLDMKTN